METLIENNLLTVSGFQIPENLLEELRHKVEIICGNESGGWVLHAHQSFIYSIQGTLHLEDNVIIEDVFKDYKSLLQHLWEVFCRENKFDGNKNDCQVCVYSYDSNVEEFIIPVQNIVNEITNSSSELFIVKSDNTAEQILELLESVSNPDELCSGDGGTLKCEKLSVINNMLYYIYNIYDYYEDYEYKVFDDFSQEEIDILENILKQQYNTTQDLYKVTVDKGFISIINFVEKELGGIKE